MALYLAVILGLLGAMPIASGTPSPETSQTVCICEHCQADCSMDSFRTDTCDCNVQDSIATEVYLRPANTNPTPSALPKLTAYTILAFVPKAIVPAPSDHTLCQRRAWQRLPDELLL